MSVRGRIGLAAGPALSAGSAPDDTIAPDMAGQEIPALNFRREIHVREDPYISE